MTCKVGRRADDDGSGATFFEIPSYESLYPARMKRRNIGTIVAIVLAVDRKSIRETRNCIIA